MKELLSGPGLSGRHSLLEIKAELLCTGISDWPSEILGVNRFFDEPGFVHGTHVLLNSEIPVNIPLNEKYVRSVSAYSLVAEGDHFTLVKGGQPQCVCDPLPEPRWYGRALCAGVRLGDVFRLHSKGTLFCAPIQTCAFARNRQMCAFCTFGAAPRYERLEPELVGRAFAEIADEVGDVELALGGATPNLVDFGVAYYAEVVREVKKRRDVPVSVEIVPPRPASSLRLLSDAGVDALIMNLELYDDELRRRLCPGKCRVSRNQYREAWQQALTLLGPGRVASALIVGLEDSESTLAGCREMVDVGVTPTLIPFRPYDTCSLRGWEPTSAARYTSVSRACGEMMREAGLDPRKQPGCTRCGGCSLDVDLAGGDENVQ